MILDNCLSHNQKIIISMITGGLWIYFRSLENYALLLRKSILSILLVVVWIYLNYIDPLFLPIGLLIMVIYSKLINNETNI